MDKLPDKYLLLLLQSEGICLTFSNLEKFHMKKATDK